MKIRFILLLFLVVGFRCFSQNVLFTIDEEPVYTDDFIAVYTKNNRVLDATNDSSIESYLDLYVNYKLKVKAAREAGLDTVPNFLNELNTYKKKLVVPYLRDEKVTNKLVKEAYERLQKEINASHILIFLKPNYSEEDSLRAYNKLTEARNLVLNGADFSTIAKQYSQDQSVETNGGELGYFTVFQMVYPFEEVAFNTDLGSVSQPFKTKFGLHILKVNDIRKSLGSIEVAHIMIKNPTEASKIKIDSIYKQIVDNKISFDIAAKTYSDDKASAINGGKLKKFSSGQMIEEFSNKAFSLNEKGEMSKPIQTSYGWHIIKLIEKYPILSFDEVKNELKQKVESDERAELITQSVIDSLRLKYSIVTNDLALNQFKEEDWNLSINFEKELLKINDEIIFQKDFIQFLKMKRYSNLNDAYSDFQDEEILNYFKNNIESTNKEFALICKEFEEGILLFEMLDKKIWKPSKDSVGLTNFYNSYKEEKYVGKDFEEFKGAIISDYQNYLEKKWIEELHQTYNVAYNKKEKKKILETKLD